jgi:hypothetical protein
MKLSTQAVGWKTTNAGGLKGLILGCDPSSPAHDMLGYLILQNTLGGDEDEELQSGDFVRVLRNPQAFSFFEYRSWGHPAALMVGSRMAPRFEDRKSVRGYLKHSCLHDSSIVGFFPWQSRQRITAAWGSEGLAVHVVGPSHVAFLKQLADASQRGDLLLSAAKAKTPSSLEREPGPPLAPFARNRPNQADLALLILSALSPLEVQQVDLQIDEYRFPVLSR